jgi:tetratricopeptide (TPR) repeat protein
MTSFRKADTENQVESLYQLAAHAFAEKQYLTAAQFAKQAIIIDAGLAPIHYLLASVEMALGEFASAGMAYSQCLALKPSAPLVQHALMNWALARVRTGENTPLELQLPPTELGKDHKISIIICSVKPERFERICKNYRALLSNVNHEIVAIHDAKSLCEGYNRGIRKAKGDILIFSHDDIEIVSPDFAARLLSCFCDYDLIGIAGTTKLVGPAWVYAGWPNYHGQVGHVRKATGQLTVQAFDIRKRFISNVQAMDGLFLAARREVAEDIGFDQTTFDGWHHYDLDFTFSAYLSGYRTAICNDICVIHESMGNWGDDWQHYANAFMQKYGDKLSSGDINPKFDEWCYITLNSKAEWLSVTHLLTQLASFEFT